MIRAPWRPTSAQAALPSADVLLASAGQPFTDAAIKEAVRLARDGGPKVSRIRVITVARIHGSSFGLQHPGLMPNKREKDAAQAIVTRAIRSLQQAGLKADGEIAITRSPANSFARSARSAGAAHLVLNTPPGRPRAGLGTQVMARYLQFRLREVTLAVI